jgi:hypothetical protein
VDAQFDKILTIVDYRTTKILYNNTLLWKGRGEGWGLM